MNLLDWISRANKTRAQFDEMTIAVREIRMNVKRLSTMIGDKMAEVDDAVAALTPKLEANHQEILLVLGTYAANQAALKDAIDKLATGATPETIAALHAASDKADADLLAMQNALAATPPIEAPLPETEPGTFNG